MSTQRWTECVNLAQQYRVMAARLEALAEGYRCHETDSGGAQCTRDSHTGEAQCRINDEDLPEGWTK